MRFTFIGVPVRVCPSFLVFLLLFSGVYQGFSPQGFIIAGIIFVSLLVHEYGHALMAMRYGLSPQILLEAFGGRAYYNPHGVTLKQQFFIAFSGPLLESLLVAFPYFLLKVGAFAAHPYIQYTLYVTMKMNLFWCLINMIPVFPLDGGQMLLCLLQGKFGGKGVKAAYGASAFVGAVGSLYFLQHQMWFIGILLGMFALQNYRILQMAGGLFQKKTPHGAYKLAQEALARGEKSKAKGIFTKLLSSKEKSVQVLAREALAKLYLEDEEEEKSYNLLLEADENELREGKYLLCTLALQKGNYDLVAKNADSSYAYLSTYKTAFMNSQAFAHLGNAYYAGAWLKTAALFGTEEAEKAREAIHLSVYDKVREEKAFQEQVKEFALKLEISP